MLRVASLNANGMSVDGKRKEVMEGVKNGRLDIIGVQETHMKGCGVMECVRGNECGIWEGMEGEFALQYMTGNQLRYRKQGTEN